MSDVIRLIEISDTPIDIASVYASVSDRHAGGVALFVGTVRDHDHDKGVDGLDYTAHPTAETVMREVMNRVAATHEVHGIAAVHRVGALAIGDVAVAVAVACAHRQDAFVACRMLIDDLKATVPIWKHQSFSDGTQEWVGTP